MGTYYQRDSAQNFPLVTWLEERLLDEATGSPATISVSVPAQSVVDIGFSTVGGVGQTDWNGNYAVQFDVTAVGSSTSLENPRVWRMAAAINRTLNLSPTSFTGTGLHQASATAGGSFLDGTPDVTERLGASCQPFNSNMMSAENFTLRVNTTDSYVTVPWDVGAPPTVTSPPKALLSTVPSNAVHRSTW